MSQTLQIQISTFFYKMMNIEKINSEVHFIKKHAQHMCTKYI